MVNTNRVREEQIHTVASFSPAMEVDQRSSRAEVRCAIAPRQTVNYSVYMVYLGIQKEKLESHQPWVIRF